ncbi:hypothetical protein K0M31_011085 [Melipona bicolor]|uniref:Uncharacterized protein n=1 Tax=Melipona bicolor TaxID=60889 RepID=A0AA40FKM9_9HYME|nr:hypothetical protein K0M31_011085 [Melipona bicolor]
MASPRVFDFIRHSEIPNLLALFSKSRHVPQANSQQSDYTVAKEVEEFARGKDATKEPPRLPAHLLAL